MRGNVESSRATLDRFLEAINTNDACFQIDPMIAFVRAEEAFAHVIRAGHLSEVQISLD
jgi:hypothetical protein